MKEWKYFEGSLADFIGAPSWALVKVKDDFGSYWLEKFEVGSKAREIAPPQEEFNVRFIRPECKLIAQLTESFGNAIDLEFCKANPDHPDCKCKEEGKMSDTNIGTLTYKVKLDISELITERGNKYGAFKDGAEIMRDLKNAMHSTDGWEKLSPSQQEALDMIQHKIGRVLNGDPNYDDNWKDIAGYATLIAEELSGNIK